ncbi:hypothetical protein ABT237_24145 [Streptomyces sp. NPDC001581]|uniref:hypothetical protein n=1 Tax=Streptomyces sp. NPDC001581 TaxID=3154386 RepID=UPI003321FD1D
MPGNRLSLEGHDLDIVEVGHADSDDDAVRLIAGTRRYLDDAEAALAAYDTPAEFFDAMLARYPEHLGPTVLWVGARALHLAREGGDPVQNLVAAWRT